MTKRYQSSGDLGDIIASLAAVKHLGEGIYHLVDRPWTKALTPRAALIEPLLLAQPYIGGTVVGESDHPILYDFSTFRQGGLPWGKTLGALQAEWIGIPAGILDFTQPWIDVPAAEGFADKVVIARSHRYQNATFPWKAILDFLEGRCVFIGLPEEHTALGQYGPEPEYVRTKDLLEAATIIKGSALFIGNQSSPFNLAEAMKHPRILECCDWVPDCCYGGGDVQYIPDGKLTIGHLNVGYLETPAYTPPRDIDTSITPPGGWRYELPGGDTIIGTSFGQAKTLVAQAYRQRGLTSVTPPDIGEALIQQTLDRLPDYGRPRWFTDREAQYKRIHQLINNTTKHATVC